MFGSYFVDRHMHSMARRSAAIFSLKPHSKPLASSEGEIGGLRKSRSASGAPPYFSASLDLQILCSIGVQQKEGRVT